MQSTGFSAAGGLPGEAIAYTYNELKQRVRATSSMPGYVTDTRYSLTGQPMQYTLSAGGTTAWLTYAYEYGTRRLHLAPER